MLTKEQTDRAIKLGRLDAEDMVDDFPGILAPDYQPSMPCTAEEHAVYRKAFNERMAELCS